MLPRVVDVRTVQAGNGDGENKLQESEDGVYNPPHKATAWSWSVLESHWELVKLGSGGGGGDGE